MAKNKPPSPSLIPTKSGDHVKTDKKDAIKLARLHRAGELVSAFAIMNLDGALAEIETPLIACCAAHMDRIKV